MPASYLPYMPDQDFLLPHSMREWLPEGHLAYFINDTVDSLGLGSLSCQICTIAVDGTKIKANASRHKAMRDERMLKAEVALQTQINALLDKARAADEAQRNEPELDIPAEIARREDRLAQIAAAKARLENRQRDAGIERGTCWGCASSA